jgi:uncharacterized protein (TIGR02118 family)
MLKLILFARRLPHLSSAEFDDHWINRHAPLVHSVQGVLGIRRYVQNTPYPEPAAQNALEAGRGMAPVPYDGCGELWWDDLASHRHARETPEGRAALALLVDDERRFVDLGRSLGWYCLERPILT